MALLKTIRLTKGEARQVEHEWAAHCEKRGTTVSASEWEATAGSLSSDTLSGTTATVLLTEGGCGTLTNTVTLANGEVLVAQRKITVDE